MCKSQALYFSAMRYHHEKAEYAIGIYGVTIIVDHPVYSSATLYFNRGKGLCVIQQRYDPETKHTWWGEIDKDLIDQIYVAPKFKAYFEERAKEIQDGIFPTVTVRQVMWALRMKPLKKEIWETCFDRRNIVEL